MIQKIYKWINGRLIFFYEDINGVVSYRKDCLGKFLWIYFHDKNNKEYNFSRVITALKGN